MNLLSILRVVHVASGALALLVLPLPLVVKKGGLAHRRGGWVFTRSMMVGAVTGTPLVVARVFVNPQFGLFLAQIMVLTIVSLWFGLRALSAKQPGRRYPLERAGAIVAIVLSLTGFGLAVWYQVPVFAAFGALTAFLSFQWVRFFANPYREKFYWFLMHLSGMGTLAIAALTAFAVTNAQWLGVPPGLRWIAWLGPPALGATGLTVWQRFYRARFQISATAG